MAEKRNVVQHVWVIGSVLFVAAVFVVSLVAVQVESTEFAVVKRFGKPVRTLTPGLHFKAPAPIETVWRVDRRIRCFEGETGVVEEVFTKDERNIIVATFVCWRVHEQHQKEFMQKVNNLKQAEEALTGLLRSHRGGVVAQYAFSDLVNVDPKKVKIAQMEDDILERVARDAKAVYGIEVTRIGVRHIGFPDSVTSKVFERIRAEREALAQDILSQGEADATRIRAEANKKREELLADARNEAKKLRGEGDAEAAAHYATFEQSPKLAAFLRELDALEDSLSKDTTLVLTTRTPPYTLLDEEAVKRLKDLEKEADTPGEERR